GERESSDSDRDRRGGRRSVAAGHTSGRQRYRDQAGPAGDDSPGNTATAQGAGSDPHDAAIVIVFSVIVPQGAPTKDYGSVLTTSPSVPPPTLSCPICCRRLTYLRTYLRSVTRERVERWDDFDCVFCGQFQYRSRTRTLRHVTNRVHLRSAS